MKRIVVCCDGTWVDGLVVDQRWKYTNVLRLARAIEHTDTRVNPAVPQVVFYQSGVGTFGDKAIEELDGIVGASLGEKVQEAYGFIAHNYAPGDEIFLFGFSRGAYTARMIADLIGAIGVLNRTEMDSFADVFVLYQKRGKAQDAQEIQALDAKLARWTAPGAPGRVRAHADEHTFSVKCVGVFDTVGSVGLPEELTHSTQVRTLFGFRDLHLGAHVAYGYQALAIDEHRVDFDCAKWTQTEAGRRKGQVLQQCWFSGCHSDVGGGFQDHDLSDLTLAWLAANIQDLLFLDAKYLAALPDPCAPWGALPPHNSVTGIYKLAKTIQRTLPTAPSNATHEYIHPSVLAQDPPNPAVLRILDASPGLLWGLLPLEEMLRAHWRVVRAPSSPVETQSTGTGAGGPVTHLLTVVKEDVVRAGHSVFAHTTTTHSETGRTSADHEHRAGLLIRAMHESSMGAVVRELVGAPAPR